MTQEHHAKANVYRCTKCTMVLVNLYELVKYHGIDPGRNKYSIELEYSKGWEYHGHIPECDIHAMNEALS